MKQTNLTRPRCDRRGHIVTRNSIFRALSEHTDLAPSSLAELDRVGASKSFVYIFDG
jgi:hypothetical protein